MQIDINYAYDRCKEISTKHYENFPVGSLLIPAARRKYIYSIYAFARYADDIADSGDITPEIKVKKLDELGAELEKIGNGKLSDLNEDTRYIFIALYNTIEELKIDLKEFTDLLIAFKQDAVKQSYDNFEELINYSRYSANPIGHLVLYVFGYNPEVNKECFGYSDHICTALQLTNFWQDVSIDLEIGRVYIPKDVMKKNNYSPEQLFRKIESDEFRSLMKELVDKTRDMFDNGKKILNYLNGRLKLEIKATIAGGNEILNKIAGIDYNVLSHRVKINNFDKLKLLGAIILK